MPHSFGYRARTRSKFSRPFRQSGTIPLSVYLRTYKVGDYVDIVANGTVHKGMPHKYYHGRTGVVWNVTPRAVGVEVSKRVKTRILKKRIHVRIEHVKPSKCRDEFLARRKKNDELRRSFAEINKQKKETKDPKAAEVKRPRIQFKRIPKQPAPGYLVRVGPKGVETITPQRYVVLM
eukprot:TRINITY_DN17_c0_g1_i1.p1 TRINITY_DN17_c0_g1~~TRINITY_DN17_c0_g1_i1.p1  ORF type:complete len:177 (-),score=24.65 TRINITY_DN17_c0_g1_i1:129-659(-)